MEKRASLASLAFGICIQSRLGVGAIQTNLVSVLRSKRNSCHVGDFGGRAQSPQGIAPRFGESCAKPCGAMLLRPTLGVAAIKTDAETVALNQNTETAISGHTKNDFRQIIDAIFYRHAHAYAAGLCAASLQ
jgi:hypothetical protein